MTVYIYRRTPSTGAVRLADALRTLGVDAKKVRRLRRLRPGDRVVNWGHVVDFDPQEPALNTATLRNKCEDARVLVGSGVPTIELVDGAPDPDRRVLWRTYDHHGAVDLLNAAAYEDYARYAVYYEDIAREYRVHVWREGDAYVSMRTGIKVPRVPQPHDWIRSHEAGWALDYGSACQSHIRDRHRMVAKAAVEALGLDFAAVDVAERPDGSVFVLEVNRAPGLEGNTVMKYAEKIAAWAQEGTNA